jgi:hypothetical protein
VAHTAPHHSSGGGGGGATCLRWEKIPSDMAMSDGGSGTPVDMQGSDLGLPPDLGDSDDHVGERCAEYSSLFGCSVVSSPAPRPASGLFVGGLLVAGLLILRAESRQRRLARQHSRS